MPAWAWESALLTPLTFTAYLFWKKNMFLRGLAFSDFLLWIDWVNVYFWGSGKNVCRAAICKLLTGDIRTAGNVNTYCDGSKHNLPIDTSMFLQNSLWVWAWFSSSYCYHPSAAGCHIACKVDCGCMLAWGKVIDRITWTCEWAALNQDSWFCLQQKECLYSGSVSRAVVMLSFCWCAAVSSGRCWCCIRHN